MTRTEPSPAARDRQRPDGMPVGVEAEGAGVGPEAGADGGLRETAALAVVVGVGCLFFRHALALRGAFFYYDHSIQNYPFRLFFARGLRQGTFPLWTPDLFCGFPLFAESQANALYPPFLLLFGLLRPWVAYNLYTVFHFLLAGAGMYALARTFRVSRTGSILAGICYMLAGPVLYHAHHTNIIVAESWLPVLLLLMELVFRRRSVMPLAGFAAASAMLALGGQPQYTLYVALVCAIFLVWRLHLTEKETGSAKTTVRFLAAFGAAGLVAFLLAAGQLLPLAELVTYSSRSGETFAAPTVNPLSPANLITVLLPHYFGSPGLGSYWGHPGVGLYSEVTLFVGTATLLLALTAAFAARTRATFFFLGLGLFAFVFSLGFAGGVYPVLAWLPVFRTTRFASRFAFVTALCVAMLAGKGFDIVSERRGEKRVRRAAAVSAILMLLLSIAAIAFARGQNAGLASLSAAELARRLHLPEFHLSVVLRHLHRTLPADVLRLALVVVSGCALLLAAVRGRLPRWTLAAAWTALIAAELAYVGREFSVVTGPSIYTAAPPLVTRLGELGPGRVFHYRYGDPSFTGNRIGDSPSTRGFALDPDAYVSCLDALPSNANMSWRIPSIDGFSPLQTRQLKALLGRPDEIGTTIEFPLNPVLDLLGVHYILTPHDSLPGDYERVARISNVNVFQNPRALPRAFVVHEVAAQPDMDAAVRTLRDGGVDYRRTALLENSDAADSMRVARDSPRPEQGESTAAILEDNGDVVVVDAELQRPGVLVLADQYYPGWHVRVNGEKAKLLRVNAILKGVALPAGRHEVRFAFRPLSFRVGIVLSLAGLAILAGAVVSGMIWRRQVPADAGADGRTVQAIVSRKTIVRLVLVGTLFVILGPLVSNKLWRRASGTMTPLSYGADVCRRRARYMVADEGLEATYRMLRDASRLYPDHPRLRADLVDIGARLIEQRLHAGDLEVARRTATELDRIAPHRFRRTKRVLAGLARRRPKNGTGSR